MGYKQVESASSSLGHFYGLSAAEMKKKCLANGLTLRSGHVQIDNEWKQTLQEAGESGQEYLICSSMPTNGQTISNYKKVAEDFNKAGRECQAHGIKFGYHNHDYEFETVDGQVLYNVLLENTDPTLVHMEIDLGWVIASGKDPLAYFNKYPGRFPLWHLKDMDVASKKSVELGKGQLDIKRIFRQSKLAGMKYFFVEQEEFANSPNDSMLQNIQYLNNLDY
jgi:sugar phosphate isomerase/epimerase